MIDWNHFELSINQINQNDVSDGIILLFWMIDWNHFELSINQINQKDVFDDSQLNFQPPMIQWQHEISQDNWVAIW